MNVFFYLNIRDPENGIVAKPPFTSAQSSLKLAKKVCDFLQVLAEHKGYGFSDSIFSCVGNPSILARKDFVFTELWNQKYEELFKNSMNLCDSIVIVPYFKNASTITERDRLLAIRENVSIKTFDEIFASSSEDLHNFIDRCRREQLNQHVRNIPTQYRGAKRR